MPRKARILDPSLSLNELINRAAAGDPNAGLAVVDELSISVASGARLPLFAARYLSRALHDIALGKDANAALHVVRKRGIRPLVPIESRVAAVAVMSRIRRLAKVSLTNASVQAVQVVRSLAQKSAKGSVYSPFVSYTLDPKTLRDWKRQLSKHGGSPRKA
ncbi:MAG: hypothetical protein ACREDY_05315 [Bradyrhizobium sp.]